jgi:hypothetical protein
MSKLSFNRDRRSTSHFKKFSSFQKANRSSAWTSRRRNNFFLEQWHALSMNDQYYAPDTDEKSEQRRDFTHTT